MALSRVKNAAAWPLKQAAGWWQNTKAIVGDLTWDDFIPPALLSSITWSKEKLKDAAGTDTPQKQMAASFALGVAAVISSVISLGATIPIVILFAGTFTIGALRLWPVVDDYWPWGESQR
jgi:hypothetical protein